MSRIETKTEPMTINIEPHHPLMHSVLRLIVTLGEDDQISNLSKLFET